jgi:hypothetical protein
MEDAQETHRPRLDVLGWKKAAPGTNPLLGHRTEEEETDNGPACPFGRRA